MYNARRKLRAIFCGLLSACLLLVYIMYVNITERELHQKSEDKLVNIDRADNVDQVSNRRPPEKATFSNGHKMVILLSYQRCGSSFTAQMFNQNPDMFYVFEPLDSIYHAMYGTQQGYSIPSDIFYYWNGTKRSIPEFEEQIIIHSLKSFLNCDFDKAPDEMINHKFMDTEEESFAVNAKSLHTYIACLKDKNKCNCDPAKQRCAKAIKHTCPINFGENHYRQMKCFDALWHNKADIEYFDNQEVDTFFEYNHCVKRIKELMQEHCFPKLMQLCTQSKVRALKTVRLKMSTVEKLISQMGNLRVIHLIRDPRGVVLSRKRDYSFHGHFSGGDMTKEAQLYCAEVLEAVKYREKIEEKYPGSTMQIIYEEYSKKPLKYAKEIYSFLEESFPTEVEEWLYNNTKGIMQNSAAVAAKWQNKLSYILSKNISHVCSEFYKTIKYEWP